ncbi:TetR/AcrR family transcriptional regulator C-terminal ligand-binding domain-containing protein [Gordonia sihwensis]|uniref:TetR/AcrR family transcriptional regulator C-terminal ligand-binding domain-containing protein n=1 Tax=Gordonia sihwensis TaxID=173559 RepID=UPI003D95ABFD
MSVPVQAVLPGIQGVLEVALGFVDLSRRRRRIEHAQDRESEAHRIEAAQLDVAAVAIGRVSAPALTYAFRAVSPAQLRLGLVEKRWSIIEGVLSRAVERGEIDPDRLTERTARLPFDLLRHETLMTLKPSPLEDIAAILDQTFLPLVLPSTA